MNKTERETIQRIIEDIEAIQQSANIGIAVFRQGSVSQDIAGKLLHPIRMLRAMIGAEESEEKDLVDE